MVRKPAGTRRTYRHPELLPEQRTLTERPLSARNGVLMVESFSSPSRDRIAVDWIRLHRLASSVLYRNERFQAKEGSCRPMVNGHSDSILLVKPKASARLKPCYWNALSGC